MSIDLSLHRIEALLSRFEAYTRPTVHIAGTNGKGSVSALLTSLFQHAGLFVGRFSSPHLLHPSDSISLNGTPVFRETFNETIEEVRKKNEEHAINASSFEVLTVCALLVFERSKVDVVLLEVGMGGRLDATNVVPDACILASVITAIDLDHQAFLGPTVEAITREKAGIIRKGKPVVLAAQKYDGVGRVVSDAAGEKLAPLTLAPVATEREWDEEIDEGHPPPFSLRPFVPPSLRPVVVDLTSLLVQKETQRETQAEGKLERKSSYRVLLPLFGEHQLGNLGAALSVFHVLLSQAIHSSLSKSSSTIPCYSPELAGNAVVHARLAEMDERTIRIAVRECVWPGRLSFHLYRDPSTSPTSSSLFAWKERKQNDQEPLVVLVDGAHNEAAARTLSAYVSSLLSSFGASHPPTSGKGERRRICLTLILALSHSPPKTPASVLVPLLTPFLGSQHPPTDDSRSPVNATDPSSSDALLCSYKTLQEHIELRTRVAFLRFSPPEGMPWVHSVPPSTLSDVVRTSFQSTDKLIFWVPSSLDEDQDEEPLQNLRDALRWASEDSSREDQVGRTDGGEEEENLVLVAGSLYLVADFYRLLRLCEGVRNTNDSGPGHSGWDRRKSDD